MQDKETIEWIVHGLQNGRFRDYLGPLSRYEKPTQLLNDLKVGVKHILNTKNKVPQPTQKDTSKPDRGGEITREHKLKQITCFKCRGQGHYARNCPGKKKEETDSSHIDLTSDKPIYYKPYRLSYHERKQVQEIVDELKEADIIEDSTSPYASPCLLVKKKIGDSKIDYLGFEISAGGIAPGRLKLNSIVHFPQPKDVRSVRSFVGLASYFRRFVKDFAITISPLTNLLKKGSEFHWTKAQEDAFTEIKRELSSEPILAIYNPHAKTELHTDASQVGLSDCNSLKMLQNKRDLSPRIGRWFVKLSEYNYTIEYHAGSINTVADALSRYPI
ncbi:Zinc knuckle [Popillia japonica]|uniref:Zinc knuckle n=1 Tax=Popillia japonica TaxID=7064 RepID=A0AAW1K0V2_POPJA